jgi:hypothetical protein
MICTTDKSLQVAQAQCPWLVIVACERISVLHELLEGHASLPDALFEQRPQRPVGQPLVPLLDVAFVWRPDGEQRSFR